MNHVLTKMMKGKKQITPRVVLVIEKLNSGFHYLSLPFSQTMMNVKHYLPSSVVSRIRRAM